MRAAVRPGPVEMTIYPPAYRIPLRNAKMRFFFNLNPCIYQRVTFINHSILIPSLQEISHSSFGDHRRLNCRLSRLPLGNNKYLSSVPLYLYHYADCVQTLFGGQAKTNNKMKVSKPAEGPKATELEQPIIAPEHLE